MRFFGVDRILIVDDEELISDMIKEYVSIEGYVAEEAGDGTTALKLAIQNNYALVVWKAKKIWGQHSGLILTNMNRK